jgi:Fe-S cluster assembly protein SufD
MTGHTILPADGYDALFAAARPHLPGHRHAPVRARRAASFERFRALGLPGPKAEAWKYTSVRPLAREQFALPTAAPVERAALAPYLLQERGALRLVFINGAFAAELSDDLSAVSQDAVQSLGAALDAGAAELTLGDAESSSERGFSALNGALAADGGLIRVAAHTRLPGPVQLLFVSLGQDKPALISPRNVIELGAGARLDLVETHLALGQGRPLTNLVNQVVVGAGAELNHDRLQLGALAGRRIGKTQKLV